jgi:signal peptidase II
VHYVGLIIAIFVIDQVTKWSIHNNMNLYQSIPVIEDFFYLTYITNDGMAFGLTLPGGQATLSILSIIMTFVLIYFFWIEKNSHFTIKIGLSLILVPILMKNAAKCSIYCDL